MDVMRRYLKELLIACLIFLVLVLIFFHKPLLKGSFIGSGGDLQKRMAICYYASGFIKEFKLPPFWNPYWIGGTPFIGNSPHAVLYPPHILAWGLFDTRTALNFGHVFHLVLAGIFAYLFARSCGINKLGSFLAGIIYAFSGSVTGRVMAAHYTVLLPYSYVPGVLFGINILFVREKKVFVGVLISLCLSLQFLSGSPQLFIYAFFIYIPYLLFKTSFVFKINKKMARAYLFTFILILIATTGLCFFSILPQFQIAHYSDRSLGVPDMFFYVNSVHPLQLTTFLSPKYLQTASNSGALLTGWKLPYFHESIMYCGFFTIVLIIAAFSSYKSSPEIVFWGFISFLVLVLSFGKYGYLFRIFHYLPVLKLFRGPGRFLSLLPLGIAMLGGFGLMKLGRMNKQQLMRTGLLVLVTLIVFWAMSRISLLFLHPKHFEPGLVKNFTTEFLVFSVITFVILFLKYVFFRKRWTHTVVNYMIILFICVNLFLFHFYIAGEGQMFDIPGIKNNKFVTFVKNQDGIFRVATLPDCGNPGFLGLSPIAEVSDVSGPGLPPTIWYREYNSFLNGDVNRFWTRFGLSGVMVEKANAGSKLLDLLNVRYLLIGERCEVKNHIIENENYYPRFLYSSNYRVMKDRDEILKTLDADSYDPYKFVVVEKELKENIGMPGISASPKESEIKINSMEADKILLDVDFKENGILLINNIYYPEWNARVDGEPRGIYKTNYTFQSLPLRKGRHQVEIFYQGKMMKIGALISLCTLMVCIFLIIYSTIKAKQAEPAGLVCKK